MQKEELIQKFNELGIEDMAEVTELNELRGDFINLEYNLPSGQRIKLWDDSKLYYGAEDVYKRQVSGEVQCEI